MQNAEFVTFGGSGLDRAASERASDIQDSLRALNESRTALFWRGKPFLTPDDESGGLRLMRLPLDHPALSDGGLTVYLGRDGAVPTFATDLSAWTPDELPETLNSFADPSEQIHPFVPDGSFQELRSAMTRLSARAAELAATGRALLEWHRIHRFCANCGAPTDPTQGGWQRDCEACGRHHFPRTDPVVIMLVTRGNSVLLGRSPGWPDRMYSLLAGFIEPGETVEAAVRRETWEEAGVRVGTVTYLASQPWPFPASLMLACHAEATSSEISCDPQEIEDARWISKEEMLSCFAGLHEVLPPRKGAVAEHILKNWVADTLD
ncbi:NAD(+) diphosphatase [Palleronia caenipelagi]|uniref:NAD(+) diphosphatase n=1 Tax=Palleronia caenipelagi TaxID=2489174 RepID=A0A547Q9P7_9RHOB|nr:NAD(+) diphosphatase [Palleronia caenipelagi]TRD23116.1 NAD(+) diphosphatase [Palleronia caenipelagi]